MTVPGTPEADSGPILGPCNSPGPQETHMADGLRAGKDGTAAEMDWDAASRILAEAAKGADDGELFVEDTRSESFHWDDGRLKSASFDATQGFGLRVVAGERAGYGHASVLETDAVAS